MSDGIEDTVRPFDQGYVMKITANNVRKWIDLSINKTSARLSDFEPDSEKWKEILDTIHGLHAFKRLINDFQLNNPILFEENDNG